MTLQNYKIHPLISIHAPRTGSDFALMVCNTGLSKFQSTLPARGATDRFFLHGNCGQYFNPRSPHGERLMD